MSAQVEVVEAQPRPDSSRGKNEARRLRVSGRVPAVVYGAKKDTLAVSVDPKADQHEFWLRNPATTRFSISRWPTRRPKP